MKIVGIFDTNEQRVGNRLSGMKTYLARNREALLPILDEVFEDNTVGIVVFNEKTYSMAEEEIKELEKRNYPLIVCV